MRLLALLLENRALPSKNLQIQANLNTVKSQVGTLFDQSPLSLWEEDFSQVKASLTNFKELSVVINISPRQFQDQNLVELVESVIKKIGVAPNAVQLEITESAAMVDLDLTVRILQEMNRKGIRVSIDDFGASYSYLGYLKRFPIRTLKIDLSFIRDIPQSLNDAAITTAMIAMGHILDLGVISVRVETPEQLEFLISRQNDEVQGHLLAGSMVPDEITRLLNTGLSLLPKRTQTT